jgi:DNA-binding TFAR19-related protein (PDSD5 family)
MIEDYCCPTPTRTLEGRVSAFAEPKTLNSLNRRLNVPLRGTSSLFNPKLLVLSILEETCTQSEQDAVRLRKFLRVLFSDPRSSKVPQDLAAAFSVNELRGTFDDPAISAALDEAVNARVKETLETLPLKADESVSAAVDTGLASAMAAPEFGKAIESVINNAPTREMFAKAIDEQLNERLTRILKERQEFEEKINDQLGSLATGQKVSEIADEVEELRTVKRSHEKLLEKSTAMEKRLKKLEDKKTP